eukprot:754334-Hanusia_phi.AAC.3
MSRKLREILTQVFVPSLSTPALTTTAEFEDSATIEQKFDTALASGQRARIHGDFKDAKKEERDARRWETVAGVDGLTYP